MSIDYNRMAMLATRLLSPAPVGNGQVMYIRRVTSAPYDPLARAKTSTTEDFATVGVFTTLDALFQVRGRGLGGVPAVDEVQTGDRAAVIDASVTPTIKDLLVVGDDVWQILSIVEKNPAGIPIAYQLSVRQ